MKKTTAIKWAGSGAALARAISKRWPDDKISRAGVSGWGDTLPLLRMFQVKTLMQEARVEEARAKVRALEAQSGSPMP